MKPTIEQINQAKEAIKLSASRVEIIEQRISNLKLEMDEERRLLTEERKNLQTAESTLRSLAKKLSFAESARLLPSSSQTGMNRFNGGLTMRSKLYGHGAGVGSGDE